VFCIKIDSVPCYVVHMEFVLPGSPVFSLTKQHVSPINHDKIFGFYLYEYYYRHLW
jgi:hypothetical protein